MTLTEIAEELGVSPSTVRGWRHTNWCGFRNLPNLGYPIEYHDGEELQEWLAKYKRGELHMNLAQCLRGRA